MGLNGRISPPRAAPPPGPSHARRKAPPRSRLSMDSTGAIGDYRHRDDTEGRFGVNSYRMSYVLEKEQFFLNKKAVKKARKSQKSMRARLNARWRRWWRAWTEQHVPAGSRDKLLIIPPSIYTFPTPSFMHGGSSGITGESADR